MKIISTLLILALSLLLPSGIFAESLQGKEKQLQQKTTTGAVQKQAPDRHLVSANRLIGNNVENRQGEDLGEISNLMLDQKDGQVAYVVVTTGAVFTVGEIARMVPFKAIDVRQDEIILDVSKEKLAQAPILEPEQTLTEFDRRSAEFFGVAPYWD